MSKNNAKQDKALSALPVPKDYKVGYGKPPANNRFKQGQSGNPRSRPRGSKNKKPALNAERLKDIILEEAYRSIKINDGPSQVTVPMAQAVMRSLAHNAVKGNTRAQRLFAEMVSSTEAQNSQMMRELFESAIEYKQCWNEEINRRNKLGINEPNPIPHPDDVILNARDGTVQFVGPMTEEEKATWDMMIEKRKEWQDEIEALKAELQDPKMEQYKSQIEDEIRHNERLITIITDKIGEE